MSAEDIITAYKVAVPEKQEQNLPGLDKEIKRELLSLNNSDQQYQFDYQTAGVEYSKLEYWDENGKPYLKEYAGSEKYISSRLSR